MEAERRHLVLRVVRFGVPCWATVMRRFEGCRERAHLRSVLGYASAPEARIEAGMRSFSDFRLRIGRLGALHRCGGTPAEAADAMDVSTTAVGTHLSRGMASLRRTLGVTS